MLKDIKMKKAFFFKDANTESSLNLGNHANNSLKIYCEFNISMLNVLRVNN